MNALERTVANLPPVRAERIHMFADGAQVGSAGIVVAGDEFPEMLMVNGEPFIRDDSIMPHAYRRVRPYRLNSAGG